MDWHKYREKHSHQTNDQSELMRKFMRHMELQEIPMNEALSIQGSLTSPGGGGEPFYKPFISTWRTSSTNETITLPYEGSGEYTGIIDWGDGTTSPNSLLTSSHTYATAGDYVVTVNGKCYGFRFNNTGSATKLISVQQWGSLRLGNLGSYFYGCTNLNLTTVSDVLDLTNTTNFAQFFYACSSLTTVNKINEWDVSKVTEFYRFVRGTQFNANLGNWNLTSAISLTQMFYRVNQFNNAGSPSIANWNVSNAISIGDMFQGTSLNQPIGVWNTSKVTSMNNMFSSSGYTGPIPFNQNIGTWDVRNVSSFGSSFMGGKTPSDFSAENLDAIYNGWSSQNVQRNVIIGFGTIKYSAAGAAGRAKLISQYGWTITDGGQVA